MNNQRHIIFLTGASHTGKERNYNHFQRVFFLSRAFSMTVIGRRGADFSLSAAPECRVMRAWLPGKAGLLLEAIRVLLFRRRLFRLPASQIILLTEPSIVNIIGPWFKRLWGCKWVVDVWDIPIRLSGTTSPSWKSRLSRFWLRHAFRKADHFLLSILPDYEFRYFQVPPARISRFENAIFLPEKLPEKLDIQPRGDRPFMIICQRSAYTPIMGLDVLSSAFAALRRDCPGVRLIVVGKIPENCTAMVQNLRECNDVVFHDSLEHEELMKLTAQCQVMVIPFKQVSDLMQTYPIKATEAFVAGVALVASRLPPLERMITDGVNGLLYSDDDAMLLKAALQKLYEHDELRIRLATAAYADLGRYDCRKKNDRIIKTLSSL